MAKKKTKKKGRAASKGGKRKARKKDGRSKKRRSAAQKAATRALVAGNKARAKARRKGKSRPAAKKGRKKRRSAKQRANDRALGLRARHRPLRSREARSEQSASIMSALSDAGYFRSDTDTLAEQRAAIAQALTPATVQALVTAPRKYRSRLAKRRGSTQLSLDLGGARVRSPDYLRSRLKGLAKAHASSRTKKRRKKANPTHRIGQPKRGRAWWVAEVFTDKRKQPVAVYVEKATRAKAIFGVEDLKRRHRNFRQIVLMGPYKQLPAKYAA